VSGWPGIVLNCGQPEDVEGMNAEVVPSDRTASGLHGVQV